ncbi:DUF6765 family protein [Ralstonia nicotianae]|nr:DUF6765 family protein [Ralstonia pseudosolanacearum]MCF1442346.1 hypothetical protein [Ralstonia solanacearum]UZF28281.1 hypothetical protein LGV80_22260 [Ralstonia sp. RS642]AST89316.1 hypothetical protein CIG66_23470 [Ralstonia pseudosolanacearum]MDO3509985.1 hypothetical protein [Ralstonia pseudosolanacearum]MDO3512126.1 hypothetical protein [Ralstonia pseudosolanacearum]
MHMNIDFHYGVIFILARTAGLTRDEAQTVAHACQYVDDATTDGLLKFRDGQRFERFASAHGMIDYRNRINEDNRESWIPFHFVPGGDGATFEDRLVCRPNSAIAQALVCDALARHRQDNALHRLGVTLHAYVDTWAHQGFSGIVSQHNHVDDITVDGSSHPGMTGKIAAAFEWLKDKIVAMTLSWYLPLGHGAALSFPDQPWTMWHYTNGFGTKIVRNNLDDFLAAADRAYGAIRAFKDGKADLNNTPALPAETAAALRALLDANRWEDANKRLAAIQKAVDEKKFPGVERIPPYIAKGAGSWKHMATGITASDDGSHRPQWQPAFETSHYRHFHDAVKEHRSVLLDVILPRHGLRVC